MQKDLEDNDQHPSQALIFPLTQFIANLFNSMVSEKEQQLLKTYITRLLKFLGSYGKVHHSYAYFNG